MPNLNRVMLMGHLTRDVELKFTTGNVAIANIGLAVNHKYKTAAGEAREEVTFLDCVAFGKQAETLGKYLSKGRAVYFEGRMKLEQWEDKQGGKRSKVVVVVEGFQFLDSKGAQEAAPETRAPAGRKQVGPSYADARAAVSEDSIPF